MQRNPFRLLEPFADRLVTAVFTKADDIRGDAAAAELLGAAGAAGLHQSHGSVTVRVEAPSAREVKADGMLTDKTGLALCTRWADCQNFVVYVPGREVLGVLHAGWKGLVAGAIAEHFRVLKAEWGIDAEDAYVCAGPSLCGTCADFTDPLRELAGVPAEFVAGRCADLRGWAECQLFDAGLREDRFERMAGCTRCEPHAFWTYRGGHREEVKAGHTNMLAAVLRD